MPSRNVIEIIIQATDAASDVVDSTGKKVSSALDSIGSGLQKTGGALTVLGAPFLGFAATAIKSAMDSEDAIAQLNATLRSTKGAAGVTEQAAIQLASSLQKVTTYGDEAILAGESLLLTFTNVGSGVFERATKAALDMSTAMKQDLKGSVIQLGKALNDPINGMTALTRVGVTFTQAQKDQVKALQESGDMMGAQAIILAELEKEFGGSAEAAGKTFAGSLQILRNRFDDVMETIGTGLIPIVQQLTSRLGDLITWFENLDGPSKQTIVTIIAVGAALAIIGPILIGIGAAVSALGAIFAVVFSPIGIVVGLVIGALVLLGQHFGITLGQIQVYWNLLVLYAQYYATGIITAIQKIWTDVEPELNKLKTWFDTEGWPAISTALSDFKTNILDPVVNALKSIWNDVKPALDDLGNWFISDGLPGAKDSLLNFKNNGLTPVLNLLSTLWGIVSPVLQKFSDWFQSDKGGLQGSHNKLLEFAHTIETVSDAIRRFIDLQVNLLGVAANAQNAVLQQGNPGGATQAQGMADAFAQNLQQNGVLASMTGGVRGFGATPAPAVAGGSGVLPGFLPGSYGSSEQFHINGPVTVIAPTPEDMAAKLKQKMRASGG